MNQALTFASLRPSGLAAAAIGGVGGSRPPHISIDSNVFSLVDSTGNTRQLPPLIYTDARTNQQAAMVAVDVVFIDANPKPSKLYWDPAKPYNPGTSEPPLCFSDNGLAPSTQAQKPQSPTCAPCPHNAIGSAVSKFSGANIKACQDFKKLAAVIPGDPDGMIYLMQIKPGSFKNWSTYINWLKGQKMASGAAPDLFDVVTRMSFESQGVLRFEPVAAVDEAGPLGQQIALAWSKKVTDEIVGKLDLPIDGNIPLAAPRPQGQLPPPPVPVQQGSYAQQGSAHTHHGQVAAAGQYAQQAVPPIPAAPYPQGVPVQPPEAPKRQGRPRKAKDEAPTPTQAPFQQPAAAPFTSGMQQVQQLAAAPFTSGMQQVPPVGSPVQDMEIPDFLRRGAPTPAAPPPPQHHAVVSNTPEPDAGLQAKLAAAFNLPVK